MMACDSGCGSYSGAFVFSGICMPKGAFERLQLQGVL